MSDRNIPAIEIPNGKKDSSGFGKLWGWSNPEDEKKYVEWVKQELQESPITHEPSGAVVAYSQLIEYPEQGLQCIQTETWVRLNVKSPHA